MASSTPVPQTVKTPVERKYAMLAWARAALIVALAGASTILITACGPDPETARRDALTKRIKQSIDAHVIPRLEHLVSSAAIFRRDVASYCKSGAPPAWDKLNASFGTTVTAWAAVSHLRFGPLAMKERGQRLSFWPDPRAIVWRQLRTALAKQNEALLRPGALAKQSVALQGLTTLELLLAKRIAVGNSAQPRDNYKCAFAVAVAQNISATSREALDSWTGENGWRARLLNPGATNKAYTTVEEAAAELVKSAMLGFQVIRDQQIGVLQEVVAGKRKLSRLPFHRSGLSAHYLRASVDGSCELAETLDLVPLIPDDKAWLRTWLPNACKVLKDRAQALEIPASQDMLPGALTAQGLRPLRFYSNGMRQVIGRDVAPALGLTIGFNELDGD